MSIFTTEYYKEYFKVLKNSVQIKLSIEHSKQHFFILFLSINGFILFSNGKQHIKL